MKTLQILAAAAFLVAAGCDSPAAVEDESAQELLPLIKQMDQPGASLITSLRSAFVSEFEPTATGVLPTGLHWGRLTPDETHTLQLGIAFGIISKIREARENASTFELHAPSDCTLKSGGGLSARKQFAKCLARLHAQCDGAWTQTNEDGNTHAYGHGLVENAAGSLDLTDCHQEQALNTLP